ncbi:LOW QUALITY PROTEIN: hypothetical protein M514_12609 [Trichuris suis]|nr:LOW QUALITY PROTEIN: hypothetical protein M514_12609 [Trichuris suis]
MNAAIILLKPYANEDLGFQALTCDEIFQPLSETQERDKEGEDDEVCEEDEEYACPSCVMNPLQQHFRLNPKHRKTRKTTTISNPMNYPGRTTQAFKTDYFGYCFQCSSNITKYRI